MGQEDFVTTCQPELSNALINVMPAGGGGGGGGRA